ncbi:MAG: cytochrome C [Saprospiraceae bacterium]|nr:MAG: cytochrome C [Saprospiraceae bacterium]
MKKKILLALLATLVIIQFIRPEKNLSGDQTFSISKKYDVPAEVATMMEGACYNCHSNKTEYPWYANVQPVAWWLADHVNEGKKELNFSNFTSRKIAVQNKKFKEIAEQLEEKEMPLPSYTWLGLHPEANLTEAQRQTLIAWAKTQMDTLKAQYPADSLILKRPPVAPK